MVHDEIAPAGAAASDINTVDQNDRWSILRTSAGRTIAVARSLTAAGFDVWTPIRTIKRPAPGQARRLVLGTRRVMIEVEVAILPGFVFARAPQIEDLARIAIDPASLHPAFSVFHHAGCVPEIKPAGLAGLRAAEAEAAAQAQAERDAETREAVRRERAEQLRTQSARMKALRRERKDFSPGDEVGVADMPALAGLPGIVEVSTGTAAVINFGGSLSMKVEAWRVFPFALLEQKGHNPIAA
ncbi:hypothetical protein OMP43_22820 [Sphingomonas sp. CBMAI 2297]|uniref:hypothetical protein n=1 Tax=Sphingomonas sp. CBMAI 2297 TaxID=2991720 RepID=UPI0024586FE0|nr:hypothetical protein [Sphingomonas sp. CBMAI 2297]MDH4746861.1 hypothetical protein [Sphingomonas sp. CBMAI 2297]